MESYEVTLQQFSEELGDFWLEFSCQNCKETVRATKATQKNLAAGGVGHKCNGCGAYYALFRCPCCRKIAGFDDEEWALLGSPDGNECPNCKAQLYRSKETWRPVLMSIAGYSPRLSSWSSTEIEQFYIARLKLNCTPERQKIVAIRHHAVGVRIKSARQSMEFLLGEKWYFPLCISNSQSRSHEQKWRTPFDHEFHDNIFGFVNNLRSALDMLAQEVTSVYLSKYKESDVEFKSFARKLFVGSNHIEKIVDLFKSSSTFTYLNGLRNVLQHRRLPMIVTMGEFETAYLDSIRPMTVNSLALVHLPANPYDEPDDLPVASGVELFGFIERAYNDIESHVLEVYDAINPGISG